MRCDRLYANTFLFSARGMNMEHPETIEGLQETWFPQKFSKHPSTYFCATESFLQANFQRVTTFPNSSRNEFPETQAATDKPSPREAGEGNPGSVHVSPGISCLQCSSPVLRPPVECSCPEQFYLIQITSKCNLLLLDFLIPGKPRCF